jgi:GT2 family glycosyltransferase
MDISVVIPTWRGRHLLETYLPSVFEACGRFRERSGARTEIVLVEDAGGDDTASWVRSQLGESVRLIEHDLNRGFSAACQTGFERADHPVVLLLNNDVRLHPDCIAPMVGHFEDPKVFAVTGKILSQDEKLFWNGGKVARFRRGMWSTYENYDVLPGAPSGLPLLSFTAIGAFSAFDRDKFLDVGGLDPLAIMVEDVEVSYRGWKRGWYIRYEPRSVAYHDASRTMDRRYRRRTLDKLSRRSRILMHWMLLHDPGMFTSHLLSLTARLLVSWLVLDWRFYWAVFSGLGQLPAILRKRRETRQTMQMTDRELRALLERFYRESPIALRQAGRPITG